MSKIRIHTKDYGKRCTGIHTKTSISATMCSTSFSWPTSSLMNSTCSTPWICWLHHCRKILLTYWNFVGYHVRMNLGFWDDGSWHFLIFAAKLTVTMSPHNLQLWVFSYVVLVCVFFSFGWIFVEFILCKSYVILFTICAFHIWCMQFKTQWRLV